LVHGKIDDGGIAICSSVRCDAIQETYSISRIGRVWRTHNIAHQVQSEPVGIASAINIHPRLLAAASLPRNLANVAIGAVVVGLANDLCGVWVDAAEATD
jgi:hypothetical protein